MSTFETVERGIQLPGSRGGGRKLSLSIRDESIRCPLRDHAKCHGRNASARTKARARVETDDKARHSFPCSSAAERRPVKATVAGSIPAGGAQDHGAVAHLVRAPGRQPGGRGFKSRQSRRRRLAQSAERLLDTQKAGGSIPSDHHAPIVQRTGHRATNPEMEVRFLLGAPGTACRALSSHKRD